jgi:hypothetical protein
MYDPYSEVLWSNYWPARGGLLLADGKIYIFHSEHSPIDPKPRGAPVACLDAETGDERFRANHWCPDRVIGDGIMALLDSYDNRIYAIGKGPSKTTVEAPLTAVPLGSSVIIRGTVTDESAGTKESEVASRFPNGVGAVADEYMTEWMQYVYKQFPFPMDATGVEVTLSVIDPNGNYYEIGKTTSDASGMYSLLWEPPVHGKYTVMATFLGSDSYWPSQAQTALGVTEAPSPAQPIEPEPTAPEPTAPLFSATDLAIIAAVAVAVVIGVAAYWLLRKRE